MSFNENVTLDTTLAVNTVISQHTAPRITRFPAEMKKPRVQAGQLSTFELYVDLRGIEPLTFSMRTRRATNCATDPYGVHTISPLGDAGNEW